MKPKLRLKHLRKQIVNALDTEVSPEESHNLPWYILQRVIRAHESDLESNLLVAIRACCDAKDIAGYFKLQTMNSPTEYSGESPRQYRAAAFVLSFLKKYPFGKVAGLDPLRKAEDNFVRAERLCRIANRRLKWYRYRGFRLDKHRQGLHGIFHSARLKIASWLGPLDLDKIYDHTKHGPGGALGVLGRKTTAYYKYAAPLYTVTPRALPYAVAAILADPLWRRYVCSPSCCSVTTIGDPVPSPSEAYEKVLSRLKVTPYNKVTFVPKTAQTHRAIAIEPMMNVYLQLGAGACIRDALRRAGITLTDQRPNQKLAQAGSCDDGSFWARPATLDMSMASDTLSYELAKDLLPEEWFNFLADLRSEEGSYDGTDFRWAKFCSMGNGFAFPLESLIFWGLVSAVIDETSSLRDSASVYGDDIIVPGNATLRVIEVLNYAGFKVNTEKSFAFGPFRESCGKDFWRGADVRPFFLKKKIKTPRDLFLCRNHLYTGGESDEAVRFIDGRFPRILSDNLLGPVTSDLRGHIFTPFDAAQKSPLVRWVKDEQRWSYESVKDIATKFRGDPSALHLQMMESVRAEGILHFPSADGSGRVAIPADSFLQDNFPEFGLRARYLMAQWLRDMGDAEGGKPSDITRRDATSIRLATQACKGWRND